MISYVVVVILAFLAGLLLGGLVFMGLWVRERNRGFRDDLTGLPNYRGFLHKLKKVESRGQTRDGCGIALIDIDHFRRFNELGYQHGDEVLMRFAAQLQEATIGLGYCARYRLGDEFVILFPAPELEKLTQVLQKMNILNAGPSAFSFSFGIKTFTGIALSPDQMLEEVQLLLLHNKQQRAGLQQ
jgi:diguanylate cyclase (GGDEF)-like protein